MIPPVEADYYEVSLYFRHPDFESFWKYSRGQWIYATSWVYVFGLLGFQETLLLLCLRVFWCSSAPSAPQKYRTFKASDIWNSKSEYSANYRMTKRLDNKKAMYCLLDKDHVSYYWLMVWAHQKMQWNCSWPTKLQWRHYIRIRCFDLPFSHFLYVLLAGFTRHQCQINFGAMSLTPMVNESFRDRFLLLQPKVQTPYGNDWGMQSNYLVFQDGHSTYHHIDLNILEVSKNAQLVWAGQLPKNLIPFENLATVAI